MHSDSCWHSNAVLSTQTLLVAIEPQAVTLTHRVWHFIMMSFFMYSPEVVSECSPIHVKTTHHLHCNGWP